jgi:hypothetical protein
LIAFAAPDSRLSSAANAAGFRHKQRRFSSEILATELSGEIARVERETDVFRAEGLDGPEGPVAVEVFMPVPMSSRELAAWTRRGLALHVAFGLRDATSFETVTRLMTESGFALPSRARQVTRRNRSQGVGVVYFDGKFRKRSLRVEFCHYDSLD